VCRCHPEAAGRPHPAEARLESPRLNYAIPGLWPGGLAPFDGGSSQWNTVRRPCPAGQSAHIGVIRHRSRRIGRGPGRLRIRLVGHHHPRCTPRHSDGCAACNAVGPDTGGQ
jgi:hypothetical protein